MPNIRYVSQPNSWLVANIGDQGGETGSRQLLLGQRLHVDPMTESGGWVSAESVPDKSGVFDTGYIRLDRLSEQQQLKIFYLDVGQGDATLIEAEGVIIVLDGGPSRGFADKFAERFADLRRADAAVGLEPRNQLRIDMVFVSHFDKDHYVGLTHVLNNPNYTFGRIFHNGLPRYGNSADKALDLGEIFDSPHGGKAISTDLRGLDSARRMIEEGLLVTENGNLNQFGKFLDAVLKADADGRLDGFGLLVKRDAKRTRKIFSSNSLDLDLELLAPVTTSTNGPIRLQAFPDPHRITETNPHPSPTDSHTINGNSIVLKLTYGRTSFLFGGDLNCPAQRYLNDRYGNFTAFAADVNKACHHGSSDFDIGYVKAIKPLATVLSSGDNGKYDHPMPDAIGAAARHSQGDFPLVFSTELARETGHNRIHFGHINARSNGEVVVMAQKKEFPTSKKKWHSFQIPYHGPFDGPSQS